MPDLPDKLASAKAPLTPEELAAIRERFEAWYCKRYKDRRDISKLRHQQGYWDNKIEFSWNAWQAALEAGAWRGISEAKKDGTAVLLKLKNPIPDRPDLKRFAGICFVGNHNGLGYDGFDIGWGFAAPVGMGGFPDEWFVGWQLSERIHRCDCGCVLDRDVAAAKVILSRAVVRPGIHNLEAA